MKQNSLLCENLAKSIPGLSAVIDRMLSISDHIHSLRQRTSDSISLLDSIFLKLNENLL